jgi:chromosome segregation ATPase
LNEEDIKAAFISAANKLIADKQSIIADFREFETVLFDMADLDKEHGALSTDLTVTAELIQKCISENARVALDQAEYQKHYDGLVERFEMTKTRLAEVDEQISQKRSRKEVFRRFIADLEMQGAVLTDFDNSLWCSLVDFAMVGADGKTDFTFKNGFTITA